MAISRSNSGLWAAIQNQPPDDWDMPPVPASAINPNPWPQQFMTKNPVFAPKTGAGKTYSIASQMQPAVAPVQDIRLVTMYEVAKRWHGKLSVNLRRQVRPDASNWNSAAPHAESQIRFELSEIIHEVQFRRLAYSHHSVYSNAVDGMVTKTGWTLRHHDELMAHMVALSSGGNIDVLQKTLDDLKAAEQDRIAKALEDSKLAEEMLKEQQRKKLELQERRAREARERRQAEIDAQDLAEIGAMAGREANQNYAIW